MPKHDVWLPYILLCNVHLRFKTIHYPKVQYNKYYGVEIWKLEMMSKVMGLGIMLCLMLLGFTDMSMAQTDFAVNVWANCNTVAAQASTSNEYENPLKLVVHNGNEKFEYPFDISNNGLIGFLAFQEELQPLLQWEIADAEQVFLQGEIEPTCTQVDLANMPLSVSSTCDLINVELAIGENFAQTGAWMFRAAFGSQGFSIKRTFPENTASFKYRPLTEEVELEWSLLTDNGLLQGKYKPSCQAEESTILILDPVLVTIPDQAIIPTATAAPIISENSSDFEFIIERTPTAIARRTTSIDFSVKCDTNPTLEINFFNIEPDNPINIEGLVDRQDTFISDIGELKGFATLLGTPIETQGGGIVIEPLGETGRMNYYFSYPGYNEYSFSISLIDNSPLKIILDVEGGDGQVITGAIYPNCHPQEQE